MPDNGDATERGHGPRSRVRFHVAAILVSLAVFACGVWFVSPHLTPRRARNLLHVAPGDLDFGERRSTDPFHWPVTITNGTRETVSVDDIRVSCGCTQAEPRSFTLPAGASRTVRFDIAPKNEDAISPFAVTFTPVIRGAAESFHDAWEIKGTIRPAIALGRRAIVYDGGSRIVAHERAAPTVVAVQEGEGVDEIRCDVTGKVGEAVVNREGDVTECLFRPDTSLTPGDYEESLTVTAYDSAGRKLSAKSIPVRLRVVGIAEPFPRSLDAGVAAVGESVHWRGELRATRPGVAFHVFPDDPFPQGVALEIEGNGGARVVVKGSCPSESEGFHQVEIPLLVVSENSESPDRLAIRVVYTGTTP